MGFGIDRRARSRKGRGLFRKAPDPRDLGNQVSRLARRMLGDAVGRMGTRQGQFVVELRIHDAAPPGSLAVTEEAELVLQAETGTLGPGYHADVLARVSPLLEELELAWVEPVEDLTAIRTGMYAWLADQLRAPGQVRIGVPAERAFQIDAPVLTPLGPRDAAWRDAVLASPALGADAFAYPERGPGRAALARALLAMWLEVPWREPLDADERALMEKVDDDLRAARTADPSLELPWAAWRELLAHLGIDDEDVTAKAGDARATIGYRRYDLEVELSGGWSVTIPGAMVSHWEDEGARFWATDGDRAVEFTSFTIDHEADSERLLAVAPEQHPVLARHAVGALRGRAETFESEGVRIVVGLMASAPHVGMLTVKGGDEAWALATWRSLRQGR